ncbi:hypothetical protein [Candidatus Vidania fulgoroideorum]
MFIKKIIFDKIKEIKNKYIRNNFLKFISYKTLRNKKLFHNNKFPNIIFENKIFSPLKGSFFKLNLKKFLNISNYKYSKIISCLINKKFFNTCICDYIFLKKRCKKEFLMKDFVIDKIQIYESFIYLFDYILIIKKAIKIKKIKKFLKIINFFKIKAIIEVSSIKELSKLMIIKKKHFIGLNNRNLLDFKEDNKKINLIIKLIKSNFIISESSIKNINYIFKYYNLKINYFLVGENNRKKYFYCCEKKIKKIIKKKK